jgi:aspartyl-tRNA(Asn)/glutamyl-tRNA(Gln) amidotransferase subunit C
MSAITKKEVEHIAELARIKLTEKEKNKMTKELGAILGYIDKLKEVDTEGIEPIANITGLENVFRKDEPAGAGQVEPENLLKEVPARKDNYVKVKEVFEG